MSSLSGKSLDFYLSFKHKFPTIVHGGFGRIYLTDQHAIKTLGSGLHYSTIREISILKFLQPSPYIVHLIDVIFNNQLEETSLVMPLASSDLASVIHKNGQYDIKDYFRQLSAGLAYMHSCNILHRDIKPQNILVFPGNQLKYTDFGLSRPVACSDEIGKNLTDPVFTLWYRSPEVLFGQQYSEKADVWALGCVFYELMFREVMFPGMVRRGENEVFIQMMKIVEKLGSPLDISSKKRLVWTDRYKIKGWESVYDNVMYPDFEPKDSETLSLIGEMVAYDPKNRMSSYEVSDVFQSTKLFSPCWSRNWDKSHRFQLIESPKLPIYLIGLQDISEYSQKEDPLVRYAAAYYFNQVVSQLNEIEMIRYDEYAQAALNLAIKVFGNGHPKNEFITYEQDIMMAMEFNLIIVSPITIFMNSDDPRYKSAIEFIDGLWSGELASRQILAKLNSHVIAQGCMEEFKISGRIVEERGPIRQFFREIHGEV